MILLKLEVKVPADVPEDMVAEYKSNYSKVTKGTNRLMLFAGDQKIEHLNDDFVGIKDGKYLNQPNSDPEHFYKIASSGVIGAYAAQLGQISLYARDYPNINYIVKINSKSHLVKTAQAEPLSVSLVDIEDVLHLKSCGVNVVGIGYTCYVGSENESINYSEASRIVTDAHKNGLVTVLWMYPRGKAVKEEKDPHLVAGAAGVALCLGTDFAKVNYPNKDGFNEENRSMSFKEATIAAGRTGIITSGGSSRDVRQFLQETWDQIHISGARGNATGRNIHQKTFDEAVRMCNAISSITYGGKDVDFAYKVFNGSEIFKL